MRKIKRQKTVKNTVSLLLRVIPFILLVVGGILLCGTARCIVASDSMLPTYKPGDMVLVGCYIPLMDVRAEDTIAYRNENGGITLHRLKGFETDSSGNSYGLLKGDNNNYFDGERLTEANYYGKVIAAVKQDQIQTFNTVLILILYLLIGMECVGWFLHIHEIAAAYESTKPKKIRKRLSKS